MPADITTVETTGNIGRRKAVMLVHILLTCILVGVGALYTPLHLDPEVCVYPASLAVTLMFVWILWSWYLLRRTLFEPYPLFMVAAGLFNGGQAILEVFGLADEGILGGHVVPEILVPALFLVAISGAFLHCGALAAMRSRPAHSTTQVGPDRERAARLTGWILLSVSFVPMVITFQQSLTTVMDEGYLGLYRGNNSFALNQVLASLLIPGVIFLLVGSRRRRQGQLICFLIVSSCVLTYLFIGARAAATMSALSFVWAYHRSIRRVPQKLIVACAIVALMLFAVIRETRSLGGRDRLSFAESYGAASQVENPISSAVSEMGFSFVTVTHTLTLVPEVREFDGGVSYLYALSNIVPNLGWDVHPSVSHGLLSDWLIKTVDPVVAASGGGLGFSFIAEAFLNFGWIGAPLWLALIGFLMTRVFLLADCPDPAKHALVASFISFFFVFARGESAMVVRGLVWYAGLPYLLITVLSRHVVKPRALAAQAYRARYSAK